MERRLEEKLVSPSQVKSEREYCKRLQIHSANKQGEREEGYLN